MRPAPTVVRATRNTRLTPVPRLLSDEFGDITKKAISSFTGKDEYEVRASLLFAILGRSPEPVRRRGSAAPSPCPRALTPAHDASAHPTTRALIPRLACVIQQFGDLSKKLGQVLFGNKQIKKKD